MKRKKWGMNPFGCSKCGNQLNPDRSCSYCIWRGDEGAGKQLRDLIKKEKEKESSI